jgi:hypothetical protein
MTLKEKLEVIKNYDDQDPHETFMKIADNYAIEFAEWKDDNTLRVDLDGYKVFGDTEKDKPNTLKELLEIYKKEKGL